ncbi:uncharacterized protein [Miscanthus floridulus]|uniref:uncharacterized protein n=1 Tax=Miscanthus floridulus TaxID=154761 RepID=UPI0034582D46
MGGSVAYDSKRRQKLTCREVYAAELTTPSFLRWLESAITFDQTDHLDSIPRLGRYPLVVDPIVDMKWLTKVLMDGGSGLNIMYAMGIDRSRIWPTEASFYGIMPRRQSLPLGQNDLPITFGNTNNYRMVTLTFEVVEFHGTYHAILGCLCYMKFMAVPNYTYLKLKMSGLCGVITVGTSFQCAYECEVECCKHATVIVTSKELMATREEIVKEAPDPKRSAKSFKLVEGAKEVLIDPSSSEGNMVRIGTMLSSK